jgi:hypothetical protein
MISGIHSLVEKFFGFDLLMVIDLELGLICCRGRDQIGEHPHCQMMERSEIWRFVYKL